MEEKRADKIQWHPAFYAATEWEFRENSGDLQFEREYNLSKEPIRMDMLIVKKTKGAKIKNEIGHIFKGHNVIEYKSPSDGLTIDDFFKAIGYACLYKGLGQNVDVRLFLESAEGIETPGDKDNVDAILQASISANKEVYDNVREVIKMSDVVMEFFQPVIDKIVKEEVDKKATEMVTDNTVELTKAAMDSFNIGVDEAMDKLKIPENERAVLKKKIVSAN